MIRIASFTKLEHELTPKLRESMGLAESTADVQKFFVYSMLELLNGVLAEHSEPFELVYEDIVLTPGQEPGYALSPHLGGHAPLAAELRGSDLPAILARFAAVAGKRYNYLNKSPDKTKPKVFHGPSRTPH